MLSKQAAPFLRRMVGTQQLLAIFGKNLSGLDEKN